MPHGFERIAISRPLARRPRIAVPWLWDTVLYGQDATKVRFAPAHGRRGEGVPVAKPTKSRVLRVVGRTAAGVAVGLVVAANVGAVVFGDLVDSYLGSDKVDVTSEQVAAQEAESASLARQVEAEGVVLLQNTDDVLPLPAETTKVNVFGWGSTQWVAGGSGSGRVDGDSMGLLDALKERGVSYNEDLASMYRSFQGSRPYLSAGSLNSHDTEFCRLYEPSITDETLYTPDLLAQAKDFSDTAIVVLTRVAGESIDCPRAQYRVSQRGGKVIRSQGRHYLQPSPEEEALVRYVAANYDRVVVVVNSTNPMELGLVEEVPGVDACLLVGGTGTGGAAAVADVLWGDANPSGRTADTYAYDFSTAASWANAGADGEGSYLGAQGLYPADGTLNGNVGTVETYKAVRFVDYAEGIYVGYRWYETADAEGFWDDVDNRHGQGYDGVVQYPFGYGLSYTSFSWEVLARNHPRGTTLHQDDTYAMTVRVTNTGDRAGKDVVELYVTAPYYPGGIEKASTVLVDYAKTGLLQPGESQDVSLTFDLRDLASFDCYDANDNGFSGYEVEHGTYRVELKRDAHTLAACRNASAKYYVDRGLLYPTDAVTGAEVANRFTGTDSEKGVSIDGITTGAGITYLTRADFAGTFPRTRDADRPMDGGVAALNLYDSEQAAVEDMDSGAEDVSLRQEALSSGPTQLEVCRDGRLTSLGRTLGLDYDAPEWDQVLDLISEGEMQSLVLHGYSNTAKLGVIGKPRTKELDGGAQASSFNQLRHGTGFPNATVMAQTWNDDLALAMGQAVGMENANMGIDGWYAPACNIHRTPLGGRNYEYYSEDPLVSGRMVARVIEGARQTGTYTYLKHLICNEQDSYRDGIYTWLTEQSLREVYLEPFRIAVEEGGATGVMTSYNRLGAVWAGGSRQLLTGVLRDEWGFRGSVITDYSDHHAYMGADQSLRAGGSLLMDGVFSDGSFACGTDTANYRQSLRRATKDVLYVWLNARAANLAYNEAAEADGSPTFVRPVKTEGASIVMIVISLVDATAATVAMVRLSGWLRRRRRDGGGGPEAPGVADPYGAIPDDWQRG